MKPDYTNGRTHSVQLPTCNHTQEHQSSDPQYGIKIQKEITN